MKKPELKFDTLREANLTRLPRFRDRQGNLAHTHPTGGCWSPDRWMNAVTGEVGELASELKEAARGDHGAESKAAMNGDASTMPEATKARIAAEMADIVIYLDLLAVQFDIDLGEAVRKKFNDVSVRVKADVFIIGCGSDGECDVAMPLIPTGANKR
jgi:NTP pyrophosphatase (non-canonical NTP hydrolase)